MTTRSKKIIEDCLSIGEKNLDVHNLDSFRLADVASQVGTSIGNIYYHFGSKQQLIHEIVARQANADASTLQGLVGADAPVSSHDDEPMRLVYDQVTYGYLKRLMTSRRILQDTFHDTQLSGDIDTLKSAMLQRYENFFLSPKEANVFVELLFKLAATAGDDYHFVRDVLNTWLNDHAHPDALARVVDSSHSRQS